MFVRMNNEHTEKIFCVRVCMCALILRTANKPCFEFKLCLVLKKECVLLPL